MSTLSRHLSRRSFLKLGGLATGALTALATGCQPTASNPEAPVLNVFNWPEYINPETIAGFSKATSILVTLKEFDNNEDLLAEIKNKPAGTYDVIVPTDYMVRQMIDEKLLLPLNKSLLPNFANVQERFRTGRAHDLNSQYSITKNWGTTGIIWQPEAFMAGLTPPTSWADFWALTPQLSGKVTMVEARDEAIGAALKLLGYSLNDNDAGHLQEVEQKMMELRPHISIITDYFDMFADKTVVMGLGWNGDAFVITNEKGTLVNYTLPSEGSLLWEDDWCIPANAAHPHNAHIFINYLLQTEVAAQELNYLGYAIPVNNVEPLLNDAVRTNPSVFPPADIMSKLEQLTPPTPDGLKHREELWARFMAG